jgi:hypothetical protein
MEVEHVCAKAEQLGQHEQAIRNFTDWQNKQNGTLQRMGERIDKVFDNQRSILGGIVVACILLALNLILGR